MADNIPGSEKVEATHGDDNSIFIIINRISPIVGKYWPLFTIVGQPIKQGAKPERAIVENVLVANICK